MAINTRVIFNTSMTAITVITASAQQNVESYYKIENPRLETKNKLDNIIFNQLGITPTAEIENRNFRYFYGADSLDSVELIMNVEKEFNIIISDDLAELISSPKELYRAVHQVLNTSVKVFDLNNHQGQIIDLNKGSQLSEIPFKIHSLIIPKYCTIQLYEKKNFKGKMIELKSDENNLLIYDLYKVTGKENFVAEDSNLFDKSPKSLKIL